MNTDLILIDWGTSNFRLWYVDPDSNTQQTLRSDMGMSKLKPDEFEPVLERSLAALGKSQKVPVLICGMAGAAHGWQDAGYLDAPTILDAIASKAVKVHTNSGRDVRILPGIAQHDPRHPDVMRGEETLLLGVRDTGLALPEFCLPGTHSKWVKMKDGFVEYFKTFMTGEIYALLSQQSVLAPFMREDTESPLSIDAFEEAVIEMLSDPSGLHQALFGLRARPLVGLRDNASSLRSRLSGLLIGSEIAVMKNTVSGPLGLIANGIQAQTYGLALTLAGLQYELLDSETLILVGLRRSAMQIWGTNDTN